jgi:hypothetical protein
MGIIRESLNFQRNPSEEGAKTSLFGFRVGQLIIQKDPGKSRQMSLVFVIEYIEADNTQFPEISSTMIMGLIGFIYDLYYYDLHPSPPSPSEEKYFVFSSGLSTSGDPDDFRALTKDEMKVIRDAIKRKPQDFEDKKRWFDIRTGELGKKILLKEDFKRGLSGREIKDKLIGFRPGQLFTYDVPYSDKKPYKEVYMFIKRTQKEDYNYEAPVIILACYIGALSHKSGKVNQFLIRHKKILGTVSLWQEGKRGLTEEEMEKIRKTFKEMPICFRKIKDDVGILPSLQ